MVADSNKTKEQPDETEVGSTADTASVAATGSSPSLESAAATGSSLTSKADAVTDTVTGKTTDAQARPKTGSITRSTALMSAATLLSRLTGFIRTWAMAYALGSTVLTSAFTVANNLPNQIFELLAGGIISSVFLPVYLSERENRGEQAAQRYASRMFSIAFVVLGAVSVLATVFAPQVVFTQTFLTQQLNDQAVSLAVFFFRFFAVQILFYGIGGLLGSLLNAHREFLWPFLGPVFNNLVAIVTMFGYPWMAAHHANQANTWLAVGTTLGVAVMFIVQLPALARLRLSLKFNLFRQKGNVTSSALRDSVQMALPVTVFVMINLVVASVFNAVAFQVSDNGPSTMQYAWLWYQLPYGVIAVSLSTALFTEMSEAGATSNMQKLQQNISFGLSSTLFAILPLAVAILVLARQLAGLYHAGEFTSDDVQAVAQVLSAWCLALPFFACYRFMYRAFSSLRDLRVFIVVDACGRVLQVLGYVWLTAGVGFIKPLGLLGLPVSDAIAHFLLLVAMLVVLRRKIGSFGLGRIVVNSSKYILAAAVAVALPLGLRFLLMNGFWSSVPSSSGNLDLANTTGLVKLLATSLGLFNDSGILASLFAVVGWGLYIVLVYFLVCLLLRVPETAMVANLLTRFFGRPKPGT